MKAMNRQAATAHALTSQSRMPLRMRTCPPFVLPGSRLHILPPVIPVGATRAEREQTLRTGIA
jgi:hypothetical protein